MSFEPNTLTLEDLRARPAPQFIESDVAVLKAAMIADFEELSGRTLYPGQPEMYLIETAAYAWSVFGGAGQLAFLQNRAIWAEGVHLEEIGANVSTFKLKAQTATTDIRFTLASARPTPITIPKGTRVSAGPDLVFETDEIVSIAAGELTADVACSAQLAGAAFNDFTPGHIKDILDPIAYVSTAENITLSSGGADIEDDDRYRVRVVNAFERISKAGPKGGYIENVKAVSPAIVDVSVIRTQPGYIQITPLMLDGIASDAIDTAILAYLDPETLVPMGDYISVTKATSQVFDFALTIRIDSPIAGIAEAAELAATKAFYPYTQTLGARIAPSVIQAAVKTLAGVLDVTGPDFAYIDLPATSFATVGTITVTVIEAPNV